MLKLKPGCEQCDTDLPPDSDQAMICSYECTFCRDCVTDILGNVCPNCGGGFVPRPVRPARAWRDGVSLSQQPATVQRTVKPVDAEQHRAWAAAAAQVAPGRR